MRIKIVSVGKPALAYTRDGIGLYTTRLRPYTNLDIHHAKPAPREKLEPRLLDLTASTFRVVLDERGKTPNTSQFAQKLAEWRDDPAVKTVSFIIGGSDGHSQNLRSKADFLFALSPLTLQHELAQLLLLEQVYRAFTILHDHPYHRT